MSPRPCWVASSRRGNYAPPPQGDGPTTPRHEQREAHAQTTTTTLIPTQRDTTTTSGARPPARFMDPEQLICPGCAEQVRCTPPGYWQVSDGLPVAQFSHHDATALCRTAAGTVADPIEAA